MDHLNIPILPGNYAGDHPVAAATTIPQGALVALNAAGDAVPAATGVTGHIIGKAEAGVDNSAGAAGAKTVRVIRGIFSCALDGTNPPTKAHIGTRVYGFAADTVANLTGGITCRGGILLGFDDSGRAIVDFTFVTKSATYA